MADHSPVQTVPVFGASIAGPALAGYKVINDGDTILELLGGARIISLKAAHRFRCN